MNPLWTSQAAAVATQGRLLGPSWEAHGVSIDTRTLKPGDLFVALKDVRDGHDFVAAALDKGAAAALVSRVPENLDPNASLLVVDDVLKGLELLGAAARERTEAKVVGITGSAGKTSTKDMLRHVLERQGKTHAAEASYNNHWGVPLTLARMPKDTEFAVIEIGMNHPGEIEPLAHLAQPDVAIVTTIAAAHLEAFANIEEIAVEKSAIFRGLKPGGTAIFNADLETSPLLNAEAKLYASRRIGFGEHSDAALRAEKVTLHADTSIVEGQFAGTPFLLKIGAPGRHFAMNALAVFGAVNVLGADVDVAASDLGSWKAPVGRGQREVLVLDPVEDVSIDLIDDAFNANPVSMAAAFEVLSAITPSRQDGQNRPGRRIAILGDMLELGREETAMHAALADHPALSAVDRVDCVGPRMQALYSSLPTGKRGIWVETAEEMVGMAHKLIGPGDVVLVKGSKGSRVSMVVDAIRKLSRGGSPEAVKGYS